MTPDERAARLHLTDAAAALRTASERLCDWLEATGQDVAGNGHVASADEATGSLREAPTAPVSSSPPPIPLGAVVTVTVNGVEWQREDGEWDDAEGGGPPNKADALDFLDRIAELEREVHLARNDEALALSTSREWESYCKRAERERDEARRALAARVSDPAPLSCTGNPGDSGNQTPAPASAPCGHTNTSPSPDSPHARVAAPRRWWLVVDCDGTPREAYEWDERHIADKDAAAYNRSDDTFAPFAVVPVVEARVTRETVARVAALMRARTGTVMPYADVARLVVRELGLTVEE